MELQTLEKVVMDVLEHNIESRDNDSVLISLVNIAINPSIQYLPYYMVMQNSERYQLPSNESITRCRRKLFEKYPNLQGEKARRMRMKEEVKFEDYSRT